MVDITQNINSRIPTAAVPGVTTAKSGAGGSAKFTGDTLTALTPLVDTIATGIGDAYEGFARAKLIGEESNQDFVDDDTVDKLFSVNEDGSISENEQADQELNLTKIAALRKKGALTASEAQLLVNANVKRVSAEFPGLSGALRRRASDFFSSIGGRSLLRNTEAEDAAAARSAAVLKKIELEAVDLGVPVDAPFSVKEQRVREFNITKSSLEQIKNMDQTNEILVRREVSKFLSHAGPVTQNSIEDILGNESIGKEDKIFMLQKIVTDLEAQAAKINFEGGGQLTGERVANFVSLYSDYAKVAVDHINGNVSTKILQNRAASLEAAGDILLHERLGTGTINAFKLLSGAGALINNLGGENQLQAIRVIQQVGSLMQGQLSGAGRDGIRPMALTDDEHDTATKILDDSLDAVELDSATSEQLKRYQGTQYTGLVKTLEQGPDGVGTKVWESHLDLAANPKFAAKVKDGTLDKVDTDVMTDLLQKEYQFKLMNAAQSELNKPLLSLEGEEGFNSVRDVLEFTLDKGRIAVQPTSKWNNTEGKRPVNVNAVREAQRNLERTYVRRMNRLVRAMTHLRGDTDYSSTAAELKDMLDSQLRFSKDGKTAPAVPRKVVRDPETGKLKIETGEK